MLAEIGIEVEQKEGKQGTERNRVNAGGIASANGRLVALR